MTRIDSLKVWESLRTNQLEWTGLDDKSIVLYRHAMYDFDVSLKRPSHMRGGLAKAAWLILVKRPRVVEVNEPAMIKSWPSILGVVLLVRVMRALGIGPRIQLVTYCLANNDIAAALSSYIRLPRVFSTAVTGLMVRVVLRSCDRVAFGTDAAVEAYRVAAGDNLAWLAHVTFVELESPCTRCIDVTKMPGRVVFVGEFSQRKGIHELMALWPVVYAADPSLTLAVCGTGEFSHLVTEWAASRDEVNVLVDLPRHAIHGQLAQAAVLILLSQPMPRWREQVGLPITEALAHGCEVVATSETGIADWLELHGHAVVPPVFDLDVAARAVVIRARAPREAALIRSDLPSGRSRLAAQVWMYSTGARVSRA